MDLLPYIDSKNKKPIYIQVYEYIKKEILEKRIKAKEKLPSIRALADNLNISKTTVEAAYTQLIMEGYVESKAHRGYFVKFLEDYDIESSQVNVTEQMDYVIKKDIIRSIDINAVPRNIWKKAYNQVIRDNPEMFTSYGDVQGLYLLRAEIMKYLHRARGVNCDMSQVIIGSGVQDLLTLLVMILGENVKNVGIEDPGFRKASKRFEDLNMNIIPIDVEAGIIESVQKQRGLDLLYLTPSHQFPMGQVMPISKRIEVLRWAEENKTYIIEDDYDSELRYKGNPIPSLQGIDQDGRVIYIGSVSKVLTPAIRISYMVIPKRLYELYEVKKERFSQTVSSIDQAVLANIMKDGQFEKHIRRIRKIYSKKNEMLIESLKKVFRDDIEIIGQETGLNILLNFKNYNMIFDKEWKYKNMTLMPLSNYYYSNENIKQNKYFLLSYAGVDDEEIENSIKKLYESASLVKNTQKKNF